MLLIVYRDALKADYQSFMAGGKAGWHKKKQVSAVWLALLAGHKRWAVLLCGKVADCYKCLSKVKVWYLKKQVIFLLFLEFIVNILEYPIKIVISSVFFFDSTVLW